MEKETSRAFGCGAVLPNGAVVIEHHSKDGVVLAKFKGAEYVTWMIGEDGDTYWGHYFGGNLEAAVIDYNKRKRETGGSADVEVLDGKYIVAVPQLG